MAKPTPTDTVTEDVDNSFIEITTTVKRGDQQVNTAVRLNIDEIAQHVKAKGGEAASKSIADITSKLYSKTSENIRELLNK